MLNVTSSDKGFLFSEEGIQYLKVYLAERGLSRRETEVVVLVLQGLTNKQVADKLCVAEKTVKFHLTNIYKRMHISRRSQIVWTLPLEKFVEKCKDKTNDGPNSVQEMSKNAKPAVTEEISIPTGCSTVNDISRD